RVAAPLVAQAEARSVLVEMRVVDGLIVAIDPTKLGWALATLLGNAIRYSPVGGRVTVSVKGAAEQVRVRVADEGPGLPPPLRMRPFDRGGGLALPLVREIVEAHGGSIRARSADGRGTAFTISLPLAVTKEKVPAA